MCGIAGLMFTREHKPMDLDPQTLISKMVERLRHRGPEAVTIESNDDRSCWLGHTRLRVTDARKIADQPFESLSGRWKTVFNGEIYNWKELDNYLKPTGWTPRTESDTERLTEMVERAGIECLHSIDGMFALGGYDKKNRSLFLARDRFGQKPLYYINEKGITAFASELSAIMELYPWIPMEISVEAMSQYFSMRYIPAPHTAIKPIRKLEPGQYAYIDNRGNITLDRFFSPNKQGTLCCNTTRMSEVEELRKNPEPIIDGLIKQSIEATVQKDASIIVSGGIDSTLVGAYTKERDEMMGDMSTKRRSYTIQLKHQPKEEAKWAKELCKRWGWNHEIIDLEDRHLVNAYNHLSKRLDEPIGDRSLLPSWCLAQAIQPHSRVAIGGDGGDELFIGYERYMTIAPRLMKCGKNQNWASLYWSYGLPVGDKDAIRKANERINIDPLKLKLEQMKILQLEYEDSPIEFLQILDLLNYLPGSVLAKTDRASMDWGLEMRSPLLNTKVALAALALKPENNIRGKDLKVVLRNLLSAKVGSLPLGQKQGFGAEITKGSGLDLYIKKNINQNLISLNKNAKGSKTMEWIMIFVKNTETWNQNAVFSLSIWTDWMLKTIKEYPGIKIT